MKTSLQATLVAASAVLLAACATGGVAKAPAQQPAQSPNAISTDDLYVAMVERVARRRGVTVRWFNPPVKHAGAEPDDGSDAQ